MIQPRLKVPWRCKLLKHKMTLDRVIPVLNPITGKTIGELKAKACERCGYVVPDTESLKENMMKSREELKRMNQESVVKPNPFVA